MKIRQGLIASVMPAALGLLLVNMPVMANEAGAVYEIPAGAPVSLALPFEIDAPLPELLAGKMSPGDRLYIWDGVIQQYLGYQRMDGGTWLSLPGIPDTEPLVSAGSGFWLENRQGAMQTLEISGEAGETYEAVIYPGLNHLGIIGLSPLTVNEAGYAPALDAGAFFLPEALTSADTLSPGLGYWLFNPGGAMTVTLTSATSRFPPVPDHAAGRNAGRGRGPQLPPAARAAAVAPPFAASAGPEEISVTAQSGAMSPVYVIIHTPRMWKP